MWWGGWLAGWVVGESDFNENPVVSLDLDLDFGLRLRPIESMAAFLHLCGLHGNGIRIGQTTTRKAIIQE